MEKEGVKYHAMIGEKTLMEKTYNNHQETK
jgi:hypothetical protein